MMMMTIVLTMMMILTMIMLLTVATTIVMVIDYGDDADAVMTTRMMLMVKIVVALHADDNAYANDEADENHRAKGRMYSDV